MGDLQFLHVREAFEYICWKLSDIVHAQVPVGRITNRQN